MASLPAATSASRPVGAVEEALEVGARLLVAAGDLVELGLHAGRELRVHEPLEVLLEQVRRRERRERRHELVADARDVAAEDDRVEDRGVGRRAADALGLELLHERGVGVARRRARVVRLAPSTSRHAGRSPRPRCGSGLSRSSSAADGVVAALDVGAEEARELDDLPGRAERRGVGRALAGEDRRARLEQARVGHLARDGPLPDEVVERALVAREADLAARAHLRARRADGLVRLLRVAHLGRELPRRGRQELLAVAPLDGRAGGVERLLRERRRVGSHVGDVALLVELLGRLHRAPRAHAELAVGLLLQRRRDEGRAGLAASPSSARPPRRATGRP